MKIGIIGLGRVGSSIAYAMLFHPKVDGLVLIDVDANKLDGELADLLDAKSILSPVNFTISRNDRNELSGCEYIFIAAGFARKDSSISMDKLMIDNALVIDGIFGQHLLDKSKVYIVSNPYNRLSAYFGTKSCGQVLDAVREYRKSPPGEWILDRKGYTNWGIASECFKVIK